jgi:iron complex outermembrane receptor protein
MGTNVPCFHYSFRRASGIAIAALALELLPWSFAAAADVPADNSSDNSGPKEQSLQEVVVTGSLIPRTDVSLQTPVTVISNEDIEAKGFTDIAEALQRTAFATGTVQNAQFAGFTQAAKVISLFGLDPSFTKILIDGRPVAEYPALYNGLENFVSLTGIPTVLVDHIDVLPGAQSSLYGSDAIAGVANIIMKKNMDGPIFEGRYGWTADGGGDDRRFAAGDGFSIGNFSFEIGGQYEKTTPIWGFQRPLTAYNYAHGVTPQRASADYLDFLTDPDTGAQTFSLPAGVNCAALAGQFAGTTRLDTRAAGPYCGSTYQGFLTVNNGDEATQGYLRAAYDVNDHLQVFVESLANHDVTKFNSGANFFSTADDPNAPYYYFEDPVNNPGVYSNLQYVFSPEESGGRDAKDTNNSIRATLGASGALWNPSWRYLADFTYSLNKLSESTHLLLTNPVESFFGNIIGPNLGFNPTIGTNQFTPNYGEFFSPVTPAQYASFSGSLINRSQTEESYARAQITSTDLFPLPGGNAGLAVQVEGGDQGWTYNPDPNYFNGGAYLFTSTAGSGHRSRYAGSTEFRLPVLSMLTLNLSGRYDDYRVAGANVDRFTYDLGFEFKPIEQVIFRGRYGTAFRAPTLADEFQGQSGSFTGLTDYYQCAKNGFTGANISNCPQFNASTFLLTSGTPTLRPITADVWDLGWVATPIHDLTFTADYINFAIKNEIQTEDPNQILQTEANCLLSGTTSAACAAAEAQVTRDPATGQIISVADPKQNASHEDLGVVTIDLDYKFRAGFIGEFDIEGQFEDTMSHHFQQFPYDPVQNFLNDPYPFNSEFKTKDNLTITWTRDFISSTIYVERYGKTPNIAAQSNPTGYATPFAGDVDAWTLANLSVSVRPIAPLVVTLAINNVFNTGPPTDNSATSVASFPFTGPYNNFSYNVYGRTYFISARYGLGARR